MKLCKFVKPELSVLTANTAPLPFVPPIYAVPYRVLPDKTNPANGLAPSLLTPETEVVKVCRGVMGCAVARPAESSPSPAISVGRRERVLRGMFMEVFIG